MPPLAILVRRGGAIESRHRVAYAIARAAGTLLQTAGEVDQPVFPRSAIKPIQALPLVESGAADAFGISDAELALATASHSGEAVHVAAVHAWLQRLGLDETALACGAHPPSNVSAAVQLIVRGRAPSPLHNNCSGKHAGMLTLARHLGMPTQGYIAADHPVQQTVAACLRAMAGLSALPTPAIDGCGIPTYPMPLGCLATAMAQLADPQVLPVGRRAACLRITRAMRAHPELVAGTGRPCTLIMRALPEVIVKTGAEGVYAAALPQLKLGVAIKVEDGAGRAAPVALCALLDGLGVLTDAARAALAEVIRPTLRNHAGQVVGSIEAAGSRPIAPAL